MLGIGDAFEETVGGFEDGDIYFRAIEILGETGAVALARFAEEDGADGRGGAKSFFDEARTFDPDSAGFGRKAATESDTKFLEPAIVSAGDDAG